MKSRLEQIRRNRTTFVEAPSGAGKTTAIQDFFDKTVTGDATVLWFIASEEPHTSGWARLCRILRGIDPSAGERLIRLGFPVEDNQGEIAQTLMELRCDEETYLICDNFQFIQKTLPPSVWRALVDHGGDGLRIVILTQQLSSRGLVVLGNADVLRIENDDLCLRSDEIGEYYRLAGIGLKEEQMKSLHEYTEGWMAALYLQLKSFIRTGSLDRKSSVYELVNELIWRGLSRNDRLFLFRLSPFDNFTSGQARFLSEEDLSQESMDERMNRCMLVRHDITNRRYFPHAILLDFVRSTLQEEPEPLQREILLRAGKWSADKGEKTQALDFFYRLRDYDAILSLDLHCADMTRATLDSSRDEMLRILRDTVNNSTTDMRRDHAFTFISMAFEAFSLGDLDLYGRLCHEMGLLLDSCDMEEPKRRALLGELYLAKSFGSYNDIEAMGKDHRRAYQLLGPHSKLFKPDTPWTFGWPSVLGMFHSETGKLETELNDMDLWLPQYNSLTSGNGSGAELIFRAEAMLYRGNDAEAEPLTLKALDITGRMDQDSLYICTAFLLQKIALLRGDGTVFVDSHAMREECASRSSYALSIHITKRATGFMSVILGDPAGVPTGICSEGFLKDISPAVPFSCMVYGRLALLRNRERDLILRSEELLFPGRKYRSIMAEIYLSIYLSVAYHRLGREKDGMESLLRALDMAMPDGLILPFAENADLLGQSLGKAMENRRDAEKQGLSSLIKRYSAGKERILQSLSGRDAAEGLTRRENDVSLLVSEGLSNREIADRLFLSENTVKFYLKSIFQKLGINSRREIKKALSSL